MPGSMCLRRDRGRASGGPRRRAGAVLAVPAAVLPLLAAVLPAFLASSLFSVGSIAQAW